MFERVRIGPASLRTRLFLLFCGGAAVILLGSAFFLYVVIDRALRSETEEGIRGRADDLAAVMRDADGEIPDQDPFAQVVDRDGVVLDSSPSTLAGDAVLRPEDIAAAGKGAFFERDVPALGGGSRLWVQPVQVNRVERYLVVASPLDQYRRTSTRLVVALLIGGPIVLLSVGGAGWLLANAALRPVRRMTEEADSISITDLDRRLDVPPANDEISHLARTLNAMLERIEESVARERRFLDDASHELRTPLTILRGELELALAAPDDHDEVMAALQSAFEEAERLTRLANDLLVLARAGTEGVQDRVETFDLGAEVARVSEALARAGGPEPHWQGGVATMVGDRDRVGQVLANLIGNAQRHARERVEISVRVLADGIELLVADDGMGFTKLPVSFERFARHERAHQPGSGGGAGLGLAIVAEIVRSEGGEVEAGNGPPLGGAWVRVRWPVLTPTPFVRPGA